MEIFYCNGRIEREYLEKTSTQLSHFNSKIWLAQAKEIRATEFSWMVTVKRLTNSFSRLLNLDSNVTYIFISSHFTAARNPAYSLVDELKILNRSHIF